MDKVNGTTEKKQVLFSIGSYNEEKRVIKKITRNGLFSSSNSASDPAIESMVKNRERAVPQKLRSKPAPLTIVIGENGQEGEEMGENGSTVEMILHDKPTCPPSQNKSCPHPGKNGPLTDKPAHPPRFEKRSISLEPEQLRLSGKVALTIAAYEGEPKTPMRLEFLSQRQNSRASSKASSDEPAPSFDSELDGPIGHRLQNELVATLKRSNLKKRNDPPSASENGENELAAENNRSSPEEESKEESQIVNDNVKKLATVIDQKLAIY